MGQPTICCIYGLYDKSGMLRYIGKTNDTEARLKSHMHAAKTRKTPVYDWIRKHGKPELRVIESNCADWVEAERRLISEARARGERLLNVADGGDEPACPPHVRKQNAAAMQKHPNTIAQRKENAKRLNDPTREFKNKDGTPLSHIGLMRDTYEWILNFARSRNLADLAQKTAKRMGRKYEEDRSQFHFWKEFAE